MAARTSKRTQYLLLMSCFAMILLGGVLILIRKHDHDTPWALLFFSNGAVGIVGVCLLWRPALLLFTGLSWVTSGVSVVKIFILVGSHNGNAGFWVQWLLAGLSAVPAALISTSLVLLRVWRPISSSDQMAPLVDPTTDAPRAAPSAWPAPQNAPPSWPPPQNAPPSWPPPDAPGVDPTARDLFPSGGSTAARGVWPPPQ